MEENKDYRVYRYGDRLMPGAELKVEHSISCNDVDISTLIMMGMESLEAMQRGSVEGEQKAYEIVLAAVKQWEQQAAATQTINRAMAYLRVPEAVHTANRWQKSKLNGQGDEISNRVYKMSTRIEENTKYNRETKETEPVSWDVSWDVYLNTPKEGHGIKITGQRQKRYKDKAAAEKYLEGRKKAYSHLFMEVSPAVPEEYAEHFKLFGVLLPGYTVEGQEPAKAGHAAEVSDGDGTVREKQERASVLEKLSAVKAQEKTDPTAGAAKAPDKRAREPERG